MSFFVLMTLASRGVQGSDRFWQGTTGGEWYDQQNWGVSLTPQIGDPPGTVPGVGDIARFAKGGNTYDVTFADNVDVQSVLVPDDFATFDLSGRHLEMTSVMHIGTVANDIGSLTLRNGSVTSPVVFVGFNGGDGRLAVEKDATLTVEGSQNGLAVTFAVAGTPLLNGGLGKVDVFGTLQVNDSDAYIGNRTTANGIVTVDGGSWNIEDSLIIGDNAGEGRITISNGGTVFAGGQTYVGKSGNSVLQQTGTGRIDIVKGTLTTTATATIGSAEDSFGEVDVAGAGSTWNIDGFLFVAESGIGNLHVRNESSVHVQKDSFVSAGTNEGLLNVTTFGSMSNDGSLYVGGSSSGPGGPGELLVQSDGTLTVGGQLKVWETGTLTLDGGSITTHSLTIRPGATVNFDSGRLTINGGTLNVPVTLDFSGGTLLNPPEFILLNGSQADFTDLVMGAGVGTSAAFEVNGSTIKATNDIAIGGTVSASKGAGSLTVLNGGLVRTGDLLQVWPAGDMTIDNADVFVGELRIRGSVQMSGNNPSLQVDAANGFAPISGVHIGLSSTPTNVQIEAGGSLKASAVGITIGSDNSSSATVRVRNAGSSLSGRGVTVGGLGDGTLVVEDGASAFFDDSMTLANGSNASATLVVDNADSKLTCEGDAVIGRFGFGVLQVSDGASMHTLSDTLIASDVGVGGPSIGSVTILGGGANWINDESIYVGGDSGGEGGDGFLEVRDGGVIDNGGELRVWPTGTLTMTGGELRTHDLHLEDSTVVLEGGTTQVNGGQFRTPSTSLAFGGADPNDPVHFEFLNGTDAQTTFAWKIGRSTGTTGATTVSGVNGVRRSTLRGSGGGGGADLMVGVDGDGILNILEGGLVDFGDDVTMGNGIGTGIITVDGVVQGIRSTLLATRSGGSAAICVGGQHDGTAPDGIGKLNVLHGALVHTTGDMFIAKTPGSRGNVRVDSSQDGIKAGLRVADDVFLGGSASAAGGDGEILLGHDAVMSIGDTLKVWDGGYVDMDEGTLIANHIDLSDARDGFFNFFLGRVETNQVTGDLENSAGTLAPGASDGVTPAVVAATITGDYTQFSQAVLEIDMKGATQGSGYDVLNVTGRAILSGSVHVIVDPSFVPQVGQRFTILTCGLRAGVFDDITVDGPTVFDTVHNTDNVELVVLQSRRQGDLTADGIVDRDDYAEVQACFTGPDIVDPIDPACEPADFDDDGDIDNRDIAILQTLLVVP